MTEHRNHYSKWQNGKAGNVSAFQIFDTYGVENCRIELIELCPCNSRDELHQREGHYIRSLDCVNKVIPHRSKREYEVDNKDKISLRKQIYYASHTEHIKTRNKLYEEVNKVKISIRKAKYMKDNKELIELRNKTVFVCKCGSHYTYTNKAPHLRTKKHIAFLNNAELIV